MKMKQSILQIKTQGKKLVEVTFEIQKLVSVSGVETGICNLFIPHTSASLVLQENADPDVRHDLEYFFSKLVPENDPGYIHTLEGADDMPSHIRSALTNTSEQIPISHGKLMLGTWQGIYLWEHRARPHHRKLVVHITGE